MRLCEINKSRLDVVKVQIAPPNGLRQIFSRAPDRLKLAARIGGRAQCLKYRPQRIGRRREFGRVVGRFDGVSHAWP